jgi:hypothetical protein
MAAEELELSLAADLVISSSRIDDASFFINRFAHEYMEISYDSSWSASGFSAIAASRLLLLVSTLQRLSTGTFLR